MTGVGDTPKHVDDATVIDVAHSVDRLTRSIDRLVGALAEQAPFDVSAMGPERGAMRVYRSLVERAVSALDGQRVQDLCGTQQVAADQAHDLAVMAALDRDRLTGDLVGHQAYELAP